MEISHNNQIMHSDTFEIAHKLDKDFTTVEMHSHDFYELYYFIHGHTSFIVDGKKYSLKSGDILLISPTNLHQLDIRDTKEIYERDVIWINQSYIRDISTRTTDLSSCFRLSNEKGHHLVRNARLSNYVSEEIQLMNKLSLSASFGSDIEKETHLKNILIRLGNYLLHTEDDPIFKENSTVNKAISYIDEHLTEDLSLDYLSSQLFINKYYLSHIFREYTNTSPHKYILKKRLLLSKELISKGYKINEVYKESGFKDYTHFFKAFKDEYKTTPREYLKSIKKMTSD